MGRASGIAKLISEIASKAGSKTAEASVKAGKAMSQAAGRATGALGRMAKGGMKLAAAGAAGLASSLLGNNQEEQTSTGESITDGGGSSGGGSNDDPIINIPAITSLLSDTDPIPSLNDGIESFEVITPNDVPIIGTVEPKTVVENYFDDDYRPVPVEAALPAFTPITLQSKQLTQLDNKLNFLARYVYSVNQRLIVVEGLIEEAIDQNERTRRDNERRRDEQDFENKKPSRAEGLGANAANVAAAVTAGLLGKYVMPAMLLAGGALASTATEGVDETLGEKFEDAFTFVDEFEENYVKLTAGILGAKAAGFDVGKKAAAAVESAKDLAQKAKQSGLEKLTAAKNAITNTKPVQKAAEIATKVESYAGMAKNTVVDVAKKVAANPVVAKMVGGIKSFLDFLKGFATQSGKMMASVTKLFSPFVKIAKAAGWVLKGFLSKPIRWMAGFELLMVAISAGNAYLLNPTEENEAKFHKDTKNAINNLIHIIGGTYVGAMIFTSAGAALGTMVLPLPGIGTVAGGAIGLIAGILFGEDLFKIIPISVIVNATYDRFVMGDKNAFNNLANQLMDHVFKTMEELKDKAAGILDTLTGGGIGDVTAEEIKEEYGDISGVDLAFEAMEVWSGTDENALAYAMKDIKSPEEFEAFAEAYKEKTGEDLRERLKSELSDSEYRELERRMEDQYEAYRQENMAMVDIENKIESGEYEVTTNSKSGGSKSWRNNNPGNLRYTKWTKEQGAIGSDDSGFAIFPDEETGKAAQQKLLFSGETIYKSDTIESAINKYAPQNENNTQAYIEHITKATGLSPNTPLSSLTSDQQESMLDVMKQHEGWSVGREIPDLALTEQSANKKQLLVIPMNMPSKGGILPGDNSLGNIPGGSTIDSATPSFMTHDPFIEFGMQT